MSRRFFGILAGLLILTSVGCASGNLTAGSSGPVPSGLRPTIDSSKSANATFAVLHNFVRWPYDGVLPQGVVQGPDGTLYGTTVYGGHIHPRDCKSSGCGTVFEYHGSSEQIAYFFKPQPDGQQPAGALLVHNGVLYGAAQGGIYGFGMVFSLAQDANGKWKETTLYDFKGPPDGSDPDGILAINANGALLGTTFMGGTGAACKFATDGCGTVFELQPPSSAGGAWRELVLHSFQGTPDGAGPRPALVREGDAYYGVTVYGGTSQQCSFVNGCGTIFELTPKANRGSKERVVYSFGVRGSSNDGTLPESFVDGGDGNFYGTTSYGGGGGGTTCEVTAHIAGCGTLFSFPVKRSRNAHDTILHAFTGGADGAQPDAIAGSPTSGFYGNAVAGGSPACVFYYGCGTIFKADRSGSTWSVDALYTFSGGSDGYNPSGPIVLTGSTIYGTAQSDTNNCSISCGLLYAVRF